jgi:RNA polymerase sigma-B factor
MGFSETKQQELFDRYQLDRTGENRNRIALYNCGLVGNIARKFTHLLEYEELYQIGYLGLISAIERFDPARGSIFAAYATPYIRGAILHYLRSHANLVRIPRRYLDLLDRSRKIIRTFTTELNREPLDSEIAAALDVQFEFWLEAKKCLMDTNHRSLDRVIADREDNATLGDLYLDPQKELEIDRLIDYIDLMDAISQCDLDARNAIELVYFQGLTHDAAAKKLGVGAATVTRWLLRGLKRLRKVLVAKP